MTALIPRLSHALLAILLVAGLSHPAVAQSLTFATPAKMLCAGEPSFITPALCAATTPANSPAPFVPVFYAITLGPNTPAGSFTLLETLPAGFNLVGASCIVTAGNGSGQVTALAATTSGLVTSFGTLNLQAGQTVICFVRGHFTNPGVGVTNSVTVAGEAGQAVSAPAGHNAIVTSPASFPSDLSVSKTVAPASVDVTAGPQTASYTIVVKNNGPQGVYIGAIGELFDRVRTSANSVPMQVRLVPGSVQCTSSPSGMSPPASACLEPVPVGGYLPWSTVTTTPSSLAKWHFPAAGPSAAGFIPAGGTITLGYQLEIRRHPDLYCARGGDSLLNEAFFGLTRIQGLTITESDPSNNTAASPDVQVATGQEVDPDCGLPLPGPITITKQQTSPSPSATVAWNTPVHYRIKVSNSDPNPIVVRLRDRVMEWAGTPPFGATVLSWSCNPASACTSPPPAQTPPLQLSSYFATGTAWNKTNITVPGSGGSVELDITLTYQPKSCDSFAAGGNVIRNIGRANYVFGAPPANFMAEAFVDTIMAATPPCKLEVKKAVVDTDRVEFGVPLTSPAALTYNVAYRNAGSTPVTIGTLIDAVRIVQPNYASHLPFAYQYTCAVSSAPGSVTGAVPGSASGTGTIVHTAQPSQGTRIISAGPMTFAANATLSCQVKIAVQRPATGDQNCLSSGEPRLENLALMDVSSFYNASLPWPPSATYNATTPVATSQPAPLTNWRAVSVKLPKCYRLIVNKTVTPTLTWAPGGPAPLSYTVTVTNAGGTLTGMASGGAWHGPLIGDHFTIPANITPTLVNVASTCSNPSATWAMSGGAPAWSGAPAGNMSFLRITSFPAGCSIKLTFTLPGPFHPGQICNRGFVGMAPQNSPDWYANVPNAALLESTVCLPVLQTNKLTIRKSLNNPAGAVMPPGFQFPVMVSCLTTAGTTLTSLLQVPLNAPQVQANLPVGSQCTVSEVLAGLPAPGPGKCKPPAMPAWQSPPLYGPAQNVLITAPPAVHVVTVSNTLACVTPPVNTLRVVKTFDPRQPSLAQQLPATALFPVQVACNPSPSAVVNLTAPNFLQLVGNIPVGATCTITELQPQGTNIPAYCKWVASYPSGNALTIPAQGNPVLVVQNSLACTPPVDLAITKAGPTPVPGSGLHRFTMTVTSLGGAVTIPSGTLAMKDIVSGGFGSVVGITATPSGAWNCSTLPATGSCTYTGPSPTAAGQVLGTFTLYYYPFTSAPYVNCASVTLAPSAGVLEANLQNNTACVPGGGARRPADLAIRKSGPAAIAGQPGFATFTLTVSNAGAAFTIPANGLTVTDTATGMPGAFTGVSATPASNWSCAISGLTVNCSYAASGTIAAGQILGTITITAYQPAVLATFTNCASVALASISPLLDIYPPNDRACVTVSTIKKISERDTPARCRAPMIAGPRGACECPASMVERGGSCVAWEAPPSATIDQGQRPPPATAAECPPGTVKRGAECVRPTVCVPPARPDRRGACECPAHMVARGNTCVEWQLPPPPVTPGEGRKSTPKAP